MDQPHISETGKTVPIDDQGSAPQDDESKRLADAVRTDTLARLRERFSFD